jgi:alpha-beta hydrolase superfamily lysophospholipase
MAVPQPLVRGRGRARPARAAAAAAVLTAALGACAAPVGPAVAPADAPLDHALTLHEWPAAGAPRAVLLALHGYGDHARSAFGQPAPAWGAAGIAVRAYDLRGFGANPSRGRWPGEERMLDDFAEAVAQARAAHPGLPLVALGESMGAAIALAAVGEGRALVDGLVLSAPAIAGGEHLNDVQRAGAWVAAALIPDRRFSGGGLVRFQASDDIEMLRALGRDPLYIGAPTPREILGLVRLMDRAAAAAPSVRVPVLALVGARDELVKPAAMAAVAGTIPGPTTVVRYPDGWHLLMRDLQKTRVWDDVRDFVLALPGGGA